MHDFADRTLCPFAKAIAYGVHDVADNATIIELIAATTTQTGLTTQAVYDPGWHQRGIKITNTQIEQLPLRPHQWHGEWNYTITPN